MLQTYDFEGHVIRAVSDDNNEWWFVALDVCRALDIKNYRDALVKLDCDEKHLMKLATGGGNQEMCVVNEYGLYSLVLRSRKSEARKFKRWITHEVIPSIRKTGLYSAIDLNNPVDLRKLLLEYDNRVINLEEKLVETAPKISFYDNFIDADGAYNLQNAARALNQPPRAFIEFLKEKYIFYQGTALVPYQRYIVQEFFWVRSSLVGHVIRYQTLITPKGLSYFASLPSLKLTPTFFQ